MSKTDHSSEVSQSNEATLRRLDRHLRGSDKTFRLLFAEHENIIHRAEFIAEMAGKRDFAEIDLRSTGPEFSDFEMVLFERAQHHEAIHVFGVEDFEDEARAKWVRGWNYHRERIADACPAVVLVWLYPEHITEFALEAPDMWAWRTSVLEFGSPAELRAPLTTMSPLDTKPAPSNWKQRLLDIEDYLGRIGADETEASDAVVAGLEAERGYIYVRTGQEELGRPALERARNLYERIGDDLHELEQRVRLAEASHGNLDFADLFRRLAEQFEAYISTEPSPEPGLLSELLLSTIGLASDINTGFLQGDLGQAMRYLASVTDSPRATLLEAKYLISANRIDEAHTKLRAEVLPLVEQSKSPEIYIRALLDIGRICFLQGTYGDATKAFSQAAQAAESLPNVHLAAIATLGVAEVLIARGEREKARYLLETSILPVLRGRLDRVRLAEAALLLAESYQGEKSSAIRMSAALDEVLLSIAGMNSLVAHNQVMARLAELLHSLGHFGASKEMREEIILKRDKLPTSLQAQTLAGLAKDHLALGEPETALSILQDQVLPLQESDARGQAVTRAEISRVMKMIGQRASEDDSPRIKKPILKE